MNYPNPYFKNIGYIGNLKLDYVFVYYDCPILFTCIDKNGKLYLCDCVSMNEIQKWLLTSTTLEEISDFVNNKISIRNMFLKKEYVYVITWNYGDRCENHEYILSRNLKENELPLKDAFLEATSGEFDDYLEVIANRNYELTFRNNEKLIDKVLKHQKLYFSFKQCDDFEEKFIDKSKAYKTKIKGRNYNEMTMNTIFFNKSLKSITYNTKVVIA